MRPPATSNVPAKQFTLPSFVRRYVTELITHTAVDVDFAAGGADVVTATAGAADVMRIRAAAAWCVAA